MMHKLYSNCVGTSNFTTVFIFNTRLTQRKKSPLSNFYLQYMQIDMATYSKNPQRRSIKICSADGSSNSRSSSNTSSSGSGSGSKISVSFKKCNLIFLLLENLWLQYAAEYYLAYNIFFCKFDLATKISPLTKTYKEYNDDMLLLRFFSFFFWAFACHNLSLKTLKVQLVCYILMTIRTRSDYHRVFL